MDTLPKLLPVLGLVIILTTHAVWFWKNQTPIPVIAREFKVVSMAGLIILALEPLIPTHQPLVVWYLGTICVVVGMAARIFATGKENVLPLKPWFFTGKNQGPVQVGPQNRSFILSDIAGFSLIIACHFLSGLF